jgi:hypothetical protein
MAAPQRRCDAHIHARDDVSLGACNAKTQAAVQSQHGGCKGACGDHHVRPEMKTCTGSSRMSVLWSLAFGSHLHQSRLKAAEHIHEIALGRHHFGDVFVGVGHLIDAGAE